MKIIRSIDAWVSKEFGWANAVILLIVVIAVLCCGPNLKCSLSISSHPTTQEAK